MAGRYQAYPKYMDSGLTWLGKLPEHWGVKRLGQFFEERREKVSDKDYSPLSVTMQGIVPQLENAAKTDAGDNRKLVLKNDFVINSRSDRKGSSGVSKLDGSVSLISIVMTPKAINPSYVHHLLRSYPFQEEFYRYGKGIVADLWSTNSSEMKNILMPDIPEEAQGEIADFLDHETAKIDTLIEKQQQLIKLLKEKRQAVISHAVTKGLNPNAPMRDSGVEWLGEVPEHWSTIPLKLVVRTRKGVAFKSVDFCDIGIRVVKASDIKQKTIRSTDVFLPEKFVYEYPKALLNSGDIILSTVGSNPDVKNSAVGQIGMVPEELTGSLLNQNTVVFGPDENKVLRKYLFYILQMVGYRDHLDLHAHGTANQSSLSISDMLNFSICFPPIEEQREICTYLRKQQQKLSDLELRSGDSENLLRERRTALISAAVTGKIDVRNWIAPEPLNNNKKEVA
ncbi:MAG: restriction endonuclease subunit S [Porticoccaceae bacterium]